jgi:hypothetical protein
MGWPAELAVLGSLGVMELVGLAEPPCFNVAGVGCVPAEDKGVAGVGILVFEIGGVDRLFCTTRAFRRA